MKYILIDIRKSDEVFKKRIVNNDYKTYYIPMNMISFNVDTIIKHLKWVDKIYIVCRSGSRSQFIKNKYFSDYSNIEVNNELQMINLNYGINQKKIGNNILNINVIGSNKFNLYSIMRIIQIILGILILSLAGFTLYQINFSKKISSIPLIILILFGINSLINGLTSTCSLSKILINYLN